MVSGLVTSPWLQLRIFSGEAREMRIESKSAIKFARSYGEDHGFFPEKPEKCGSNRNPRSNSLGRTERISKLPPVPRTSKKLTSGGFHVRKAPTRVPPGPDNTP